MDTNEANELRIAQLREARARVDKLERALGRLSRFVLDYVDKPGCNDLTRRSRFERLRHEAQVAAAALEKEQHG